MADTTNSPKGPIEVLLREGDMEKPENDSRAYRCIKLPNRLEALLIHDPDVDKSSASIDVNVGNLNNPDDMPGAAHAIEHLVFMGSKRFPEANAYKKYVTDNNGEVNADTSDTSTNFHFDIAAQSDTAKHHSPLYTALDMLAQSITEPLFEEATLKSELHNVDSEHKRNLPMDHRRIPHLLASLSNPEHPASRFAPGNYETLYVRPSREKRNVRAEFSQFHGHHYSANGMKVVVLGRENLDQLQSWVVELFSNIKDIEGIQGAGTKRPAASQRDQDHLLTEKELLTQIFVKPILDQHVLFLQFPCSVELDLEPYGTEPAVYLIHLIGHEGYGSIFSFIRNKGWATAVSAELMRPCPDTAIFGINVNLTLDGVENYGEIVMAIFEYIAMLNEEPIHEWVWNEMKQISEIKFRFREKTQSMATTRELSQVMQRGYQKHHLLGGSHVKREYNPDAIRKVLESLRPDNFRMVIISPQLPVDFNKKEVWYGTEYQHEKMSPAFVAAVKKAASKSANERKGHFHLPEKNTFIPSSLEVKRKTDVNMLKLIRNDTKVSVWYKDGGFRVPRVNFYIIIHNPLVNTSHRNIAMTHIMCSLVDDALVEKTYGAKLLAVTPNVEHNSHGVAIEFKAYDAQMSTLVERVVGTLRHLDLGKERFQVVKESHRQWFVNKQRSSPRDQAGDYARWLKFPDAYIDEDMLAQLSDITAKDVQSFIEDFMKERSHLEILAHGNLQESEVLGLVKLVESKLDAPELPRSQWPDRRKYLLPSGCNYIYERTLPNPENCNNCVQYICSIDNHQDPVLKAKLFLWSNFVEEIAFNGLRTRKHLGYDVSNGPSDVEGWLSYRVYIESDYAPSYLEQSIENMLLAAGEEFAKMEPDQFTSLQEATKKRRKEKPQNLSDETERILDPIRFGYYNFQLREREITAISDLSKEDVLSFFKDYISPKTRCEGSKISVHLRAQATSFASRVTEFLRESLAAPKEDSNVESKDAQKKSVDMLNDRLKDVAIIDDNVKVIDAAISKHLEVDLEVECAKIDGLLKQVHHSILPQFGIGVTTSGEKIVDARRFREKLPQSEGAKPREFTTKLGSV